MTHRVRPASPGEPAVVGLALAAVLAAAFAQGSWEWFSTYIGLTLIALIVCFYPRPAPTSGDTPAYARDLTAYALILGLSAALALAPAIQRWPWLFPMPATRADCPSLGTYAALRTSAALPTTPAPPPDALSFAARKASHEAVADCLAFTTTRWLPVYAIAVALLVAASVHLRNRPRRGGPGQVG
ncbi:hypothetical protein ABZ714_01870 [Streptomyces sp. NPDC006798]|uniref:hypothetical protein n=1 Tax=Streptomyces sp. NPDC006798 TaxID=3155462 RepID=UPI00340F6062